MWNNSEIVIFSLVLSPVLIFGIGLLVLSLIRNTNSLGFVIGGLMLLFAVFAAFIQVETPKIGGVWFSVSENINQSFNTGAQIKWSFILDIAGRLMCFLILAISGLVCIFSVIFSITEMIIINIIIIFF